MSKRSSKSHASNSISTYSPSRAYGVLFAAEVSGLSRYNTHIRQCKNKQCRQFYTTYNRVQLLNTTHCNIRNNFVYSKHRAPFISVVCLFVCLFVFEVCCMPSQNYVSYPFVTQRNKWWSFDWPYQESKLRLYSVILRQNNKLFAKRILPKSWLLITTLDTRKLHSFH